jgi:hypothetical protein
MSAVLLSQHARSACFQIPATAHARRRPLDSRGLFADFVGVPS